MLVLILNFNDTENEIELLYDVYALNVPFVRIMITKGDAKIKKPNKGKKKISVQLHYVYPFNVSVQMGLKESVIGKNQKFQVQLSYFLCNRN